MSLRNWINLVEAMLEPETNLNDVGAMIRQHYARDSVSGLDLPDEVLNFLKGLHAAYQRGGGNMPLTMCVKHLTWQEAKPTGPTKNEFHPDYKYEAVFWPDMIDAVLDPDFRKFVMASPAVVKALGWHVSRDSMVSTHFEKIESEAVPARKLWHVTLTHLVPQIMQHGLALSKSSAEVGHRYAQPRIYLATTKRAVTLIIKKFREIDQFKDRQRSYSVVTVDPKKVKGMTFHNDVEFARRGIAVYATKAIPPEAITGSEDVVS